MALKDWKKIENGWKSKNYTIKINVIPFRTFDEYLGGKTSNKKIINLQLERNGNVVGLKSFNTKTQAILSAKKYMEKH